MRDRQLWPMVRDSSAVGQQIASVVICVAVSVHLYTGAIQPISLVLLNGALLLAGGFGQGLGRSGFRCLTQ